MITDNTKTIVKPIDNLRQEESAYKKISEAFLSERTKKFLTNFILVFAIFASIYKFVLPNFIKPELVYGILKSSLVQGYNLDIKNLRTDLSWDLALVLDADEVSLSDSKQKLLFSKKTNIKIPLLMLLFHKFDNSQFYSTYLDTHLERDQNGVFNIKKAFKFKKSSSEIAKFRVAIKDYGITFVDYGSKPIVLNGYNLDLGNLKLYRLKTFGTIAFPDGERTILNVNFISKKPISRGEFVLKGNVENLDIKKIEKYLKEFCPEITKAQGVVTGDFDVDAYGHEKLTNNLKVSLNTNNVYISTKKYLNFFEIADDAQIFAEGKYYHHKLNLKKCRVVSRDYNLDLVGKIKDIDKDVKHLDIKIKSKNSNLRKLMGLVPKTAKVKHDGVNKALKHKVNAFVNCNLKVKGASNSAKYWGDLNIKHLVVDGDVSKSKSHINLSYKRRKITIKGWIYDSTGGLVETGGTSILGRTPRVDFKVQADRILLSELRKHVLAMSDILELSSGILPKLQPSGVGKINATVKGSGKKANMDGYFQVFDSMLVYQDLCKPVFVKFANIKLQQRKMFFENQEGFVDSHKIVADGFVSLDKETDMELVAKNFSLHSGIFVLGHSRLFEKAQKAMSKIETASGNINFDVRLTSDRFHPMTPNGTVWFLKNSIKLTDFSPQITNLVGDISVDGNNYTVNNLSASALNSPVSVEGDVKNSKIDVKITAPKVDWAQAVKGILTSKASVKLAPLFVDVKKPLGSLPVVLYLKGDTNSDFFDKIECDNLRGKFYFGEFLAPVTVSQGKFSSTKDEFHSDKILFNILNANGVLDGKVAHLSQKPQYDLTLSISNIDKSVFDACKTCRLSHPLRKILNSIGDFSGSASGQIKIKQSLKGKITFNNIGFRYIPASLPVKIKNGDLLVDGDKISLSNSFVNVGGSKFNLGAVFEKNKGFAVDLSGNLTPEEIDKYLNKLLLAPLNLKKSAPVKIKITNSNSSGLKVVGGVLLRPDNIISYKGISFGDDSNSYVLGGGYSSFNHILNFNHVGVCQYPNEFMALLGFNNLLLPKNFCEISGWVRQKSLEENLHVYSREFMNINLLNEFMSKKFGEKLFKSGSFKGDVALKGRVDAPKIVGNVELRSAKISSFKMDIPTLKIIFTNEFIYLKDGVVRLADSEFGLDGVAENVIEMPYVFKDISIKSDYVDIDEIIKVFNKDSIGKGTLPLFVVKKGTMAAKKLIISNLTTDDAVADFSFTPDWIMSLDKFAFSTAGGEVTGDMTFDFSNYESKTYMKFKNLKANAVATTLIQMPNEIYGLLNGEARFTTRGVAQSDLIKNSNGNVKFQITSGRLVRLGSLEYLLRAAEVMKSGVTGLCLNNLCTLISPRKTGNFDTINVDFKVKNGVLFTDDLVSRGQHLNIYLAGNFDMITNYSDFTILGRVSKSAVNILGPLGNLSITKVLSILPDKNDSGNAVLNSLSKFPGVDFNDKTYRRFVVNIEGDLYNPKSVKNFRWVD